VANEVVQRAYASFVLYRIYQDMFRRGRQERLTHALFFAEGQRLPAAVRLVLAVD
jgi:DNA phosphorothioation-dependent restriction protein DptH